MKHPIRILSLVLALLLLLGTTDACFASFSAKVISSKMPVYTAADTAAAKLGTLKKGKSFTVLSYEGDWAEVKAGGKTGYAQISAMQFSTGKTMYTNRTATVYKTASTKSKLTKLAINTTVKVVGWSGAYYRVTKSGKTGYIPKAYLSDKFTETGAYLKTNAVLYGSASTAKPQKTYLKGTAVTLKSVSGGYYAAIIDGAAGYVKTSAVTAKKPSVTKKTMYAAKDCTVYNLSNGTGALTTLEKAQKVTAVGSNSKCWAIANGNRVGFVKKSCLSTKKPKVTTGASLMPKALRSTQKSYSKSMSAAKKIEHVIYYAQSKLGCKYSSNPNNSTTFDCLTLVYYAFRASGKTVGDTPKGCASMSCKTIYSASSLKRGDIVCFDTSECGHCNHVGIYVGSGQFLHASSGGGKVMLSSLSKEFYKNCFLGAKRVFE